MSKKYSILELLELEKTSEQAVEEPVSSWLEKLWDMGVGGIS